MSGGREYLTRAERRIPLVHESTEATPFEDASFDIVYVPL
jgi:hypothetical protein